MSELERQFSDWRRRMTGAVRDRTDAIDELEEHLRDRVEALVSQGATASEAFLQAEQELGDPSRIALEFQRCGQAQGLRSARMLACAGGLISTAGFVFYFSASLSMAGWLFRGSRSAFQSGWLVFWQVLAALITLTSALALLASLRFLARPNERDLRSVNAFSLLAGWIALGWAAQRSALLYELKVALILALLAGLVVGWSRLKGSYRNSQPTPN